MSNKLLSRRSVIRVFSLVSIIVLLLVCSIRMPVFTTNSDDRSLQFVDPVNLESHVRILSEKYIPRSCVGTGALDNAAAYIKDEFKKSNLNTVAQPYLFGGRQYSNIMSMHGPDSGKTIVVGAHYDAYLDYPGADDNASGVAGLLELNRLFSGAKSLMHRVVLVAYACEEPPHYAGDGMGSVVHAASLTDTDVELMISLEMIGYFTDEKNSQKFPVPALSLLYPDGGNFIGVVGKLGTLDASRLKASINRATNLNAYSINAPISVPGIDFSDHRSYWALGYPAVMVTDTSFYRNQHYHKPSDTFEKLNYESMAQVVYGVYVHVVELASKP